MMEPGKKTPKEVAEILGTKIEVGGFVIVNEASSEEMTEFLITPMPGGCIHVPPPPPNYVLHVVMPSGKKAQYTMGPMMITGILRLPRKEEDRKYYSLEVDADSAGPFRNTD